MTDLTPEKLAELRAVAEAAEPMMVFGGLAQTTFVTMEKSDVLALIAALEAKTAEVEDAERETDKFENLADQMRQERDAARKERDEARAMVEARVESERVAFAEAEQFKAERDEARADAETGVEMHAHWQERAERAEAAIAKLSAHIHELWQSVESSPYRNALGDLVGWMTDQNLLVIIRHHPITIARARAEAAEGRAETAEAALERVKALHYRAEDYGPICAECTGKIGDHWHPESVSWPCPTIEAIEGADDE